MKTKLALSAVVAALAVFSQGAFAQAASAGAPANRSDVKFGAQSKSVAPAGEKPTAAPSTASDKTRDERKETTKSDKASGKLAPAGDAGGQKEDKAMKSTGTETTKEARKEKTKTQQKNKELKPAGEASK